MATISFHNAVQPAGSSTGTAISRATPATLQDNDLLLAIVTHSSSLTTVPSGWTLIRSQNYTAVTTTHTISVYQKDQVSSSDSAVSVDFVQASSGPWSLGTIAFRAGTQYTISLQESNGSANNNITTFAGTPPTLTAVKVQEMFVYALGTLKITTGTTTGPTSATVWSGTTGTGKYQAGSYQNITATNSNSGTMTYSSGSTTDNAVGIITMRFYAAPAPDTVSETVDIDEDTPAGWNAATEVVEDTELGDVLIFGRDLVDTLTEQVDLNTVANLGVIINASDAFEVGETANVIRLQTAAISHTIRLIDLAYRDQLFRVTQTDGIIGTDTANYRYNPGAIITEQMRITRTAAPQYRARPVITDTARLTDNLLAGMPMVITQTLTLGDVLLTVRAAHVIEQLNLGLAQIPNLRSRLSVLDRVRLRDSLANFFGGELTDSVTFSRAVLPIARKPGLVNETVNVGETIAPKFVLRVTTADILQIDDVDLLKMLFRPTIEEGVQLSAAYVQPNDSITTWAINTVTGATTEYQDYQFNSFARMGLRYLGASADGLFELDGDTDDGEDIVAKIKSGYAQFAGSRYSSFKAAYLGMHADGYIFLKLETGDGKTYTYKSMLQNMQTTKVLLGKGLRARYFAFELTTTGQDFDLDTIEFIPIMARRRV